MNYCQCHVLTVQLPNNQFLSFIPSLYKRDRPPTSRSPVLSAGAPPRSSLTQALIWSDTPVFHMRRLVHLRKVRHYRYNSILVDLTLVSDILSAIRLVKMPWSLNYSGLSAFETETSELQSNAIVAYFAQYLFRYILLLLPQFDLPRCESVPQCREENPKYARYKLHELHYTASTFAFGFYSLLSSSSFA